MNDTPDSTRETVPGEGTEAEVLPVDVMPVGVELTKVEPVGVDRVESDPVDDVELTEVGVDGIGMVPVGVDHPEVEPVEMAQAEVELAETAAVETRIPTARVEAERSDIHSDTVPPAQRRGSVVPMVIGGVLAAAVGFGLAQVVPQGWPIMDNSGVSAEVKAQAATIAGLQTRLDELAQAPAPKVDPAVSDRLAAVEATVANLPAPVGVPADLTARLDALEQQLAAAPVQPEGTPGVDPGVDAAAMAQLQAEIAALKSGGAALDTKMAEAAGKLDSIKAEAEAVVTQAAARAALHQLQAALDSGAPYGSALADLAGASVPEVLTVHAAAGLPSLQSLRSSFPQAARAALDASLQATTADTWTDRVGTFLRGQTGARSLTPRQGADPDAVLSRAEATLAAGDLTGALTELGGLPEVGKAAMADWLAQAQQRQDAAAAVQVLSAGLGQ